jgi:GT2 family glycosyltransferase
VFVYAADVFDSHSKQGCWSMKSAASLKTSSFPNSPRVWVLVLSWNNWTDTNECLASLRLLDYAASRVLVLDNGSTDGSVLWIQERFPEFEIIELGENLGFAKANNVGIRLALEGGADYIWLLNNDTVVHPGALRAMVEKAERDPRIGAVGSAIYDMSEPERLKAWGGGRVNMWLGRSRIFSDPAADEKIQFLTGASLLLRRSLFESIGFLDEEFFFYWEDADYCFRMRSAGWLLTVAGESKVWHKEWATARKNSLCAESNFNKGAIRFFNKHAVLPYLTAWIGIVIRMARRALLGEWRSMHAIWTAAWRTTWHRSGSAKGG